MIQMDGRHATLRLIPSRPNLTQASQLSKIAQVTVGKHLIDSLVIVCALLLDMVRIDWDPVPRLGIVPINWYGLTFLLGFVVAWALVRRWARPQGIPPKQVDQAFVWIVWGTIAGARLYYVAQNDPGAYLRNPLTILEVWEGGLAFFGGLMGATLAAYLFARREGLPFPKLADLFAPAIPIGAAIGRTTCGLAGMDYGSPTSRSWGVIYTNPQSYAPLDGIARHPTPYYELLGDLAIAAVLLRFRGKLSGGRLFLLYLAMFAALRFCLFFFRGDVPDIALGLKNGQWTAIAILAVAVARYLTLPKPRLPQPRRAL
jgi:phosphatidylglycerol:prolipoprotein diacylglycerol transferase